MPWRFGKASGDACRWVHAHFESQPQPLEKGKGHHENRYFAPLSGQVLPSHQANRGAHAESGKERSDRKEEYVIDEGYWIDWPDQRRDSEFLTAISLGVVRKVREYAAMNGIDAIVCPGSMEPAFFPAREISDIPYMGALHSALHVASLLGERCTVIEATDPQLEDMPGYGFGDKLVSVRCPGYSSTRMGELIDADSKKKRGSRPEVRRCIEDILKQCIASVEQDGADCLILAWHAGWKFLKMKSGMDWMKRATGTFC